MHAKTYGIHQEKGCILFTGDLFEEEKKTRQRIACVCSEIAPAFFPSSLPKVVKRSFDCVLCDAGSRNCGGCKKLAAILIAFFDPLAVVATAPQPPECLRTSVNRPRTSPKLPPAILRRNAPKLQRAGYSNCVSLLNISTLKCDELFFFLFFLICIILEFI